MVVYWDLALLWNGMADYLILLSAARLAGRTVPRTRLIGAATLGGVYGAAQLILPQTVLLSAAVFAGMVLLAFHSTGRALKLGLLTLLLACALSGGAMLLGRCCGSMGRLARGIVYADLQWGVLLGVMGLTYFLLSTVFCGGARCCGESTVTVTLTHEGKQVSVRLLYDSGNLLSDPANGESVPVIGESALRCLLPKEEKAYIWLHCTTAYGTGMLRAFYCDSLCVRGTELGRRLIAVSPMLYGDGGFQGVWRAEQGGRYEPISAALE